MSDTSSKKMDEKHVVYPESRHAKLAMYASIKSQLKIMLAPKVEGDLDKIVFTHADKLIKDALTKKEAVKDTYFKIGLIGSDLVVRVKAQQAGLKQILGYDQKDALLLKGCKLKSASSSKATEDIDFPTFMVLTKGDCKPIVNEYFDIDKGYGLKLSVKVEGADKNSGLRARVTDVHKKFCAEYQKNAEAIADDLAATLSKLTVKSGTTLKETAKQAQLKLEALLDQATISKAFEDRVIAMVAQDANFKQHAREWKIKGACTAIITTISLAATIARLVASHGADIMAYKNIVSCAKTFYDLISDFMKTEQEVAAELDKAIALYEKSAKNLLTEIQATYDANTIAAKTKLQKIKALAGTAGDALSMAQDKITKAIKDFTGKDIAQLPEQARLRYLTELGKLINALDAKYKELTKAIDKFKDSSIRDAVKAWPAIQELKKACSSALETLGARKEYAADAKAKIAALNIKVDDSTDLDKLKTMVAGLRDLNAGKIIGGAVTVATIAIVPSRAPMTRYRTWLAPSASSPDANLGALLEDNERNYIPSVRLSLASVLRTTGYRAGP